MTVNNILQRDTARLSWWLGSLLGTKFRLVALIALPVHRRFLAELQWLCAQTYPLQSGNWWGIHVLVTFGCSLFSAAAKAPSTATGPGPNRSLFCQWYHSLLDVEVAGHWALLWP